MQKGEFKRFAIAALVVTSFTLPIFRSGGRTGLTFWGWIINHTILGPPVEYVPEEDYAKELKGVTITRGVRVAPSEANIERVMANYQLSRQSAIEMLSHQEV